MKKEILKLTGLTESQFYKKYPTQAAFEADYPEMKLGGTPEAFPQIATADNFFSYGVPVPPTYYMSGGPVYPQIQTEAQFFSPVYSNSNNAYAVGGSYMEAYPQAKIYPQGPVGGSSFYMMQDGGQGMPEPQKDQTFYTQKMNSFFDKLRQAAYKNLQNGIMNSEPDTTSAMPELGMGRYGGMPSFQPGGGIPADMIYDTFDYEVIGGRDDGQGLPQYKIPRNEQTDMFYGRKKNFTKNEFEDYSTRYGFDVAKELKDYPGLMQQVVDSNFNSTQDPRYLLLVAAGAISPNFADRFNVNKGAGNLQRLWDQNKELVFQQYKDDPEAFIGAVGDYRKMLYQNTNKKGFDSDYFKTLKTSKEKSDYLSGLQVSDAFTKSWNPRVDKMTANALSRIINPQAAANQSTPAAAPAPAAVTTNPSNSQVQIPAPGTPVTALDGVNNQSATAANNSNFIEPNRSAELFGDTGDPTTSYRTVTTADGQTFVVGPNNQLYSPFKGNQTTTTNTQQQVYNPYPYMNRNGIYVGTGFDNVANFLIPNNPRESYRNIREMEGMGMGDLTPEERAAFLSGNANLSKLDIQTRRAMQKGNRLKSITAEFNTGPSRANNPAAVVLGPPPANASTTTTSTIANQNQSAAPGSTSTSSTATQPGNAANPNATTSTQPATSSTTSTTSSKPSIDPNTGEYEMPSAIAARIEKAALDAEIKNHENYKKIREMQIRQGKTPDAYDPNTNYDYGSKAASAQGTVDYSPSSQNAASNPAANATTSSGSTTTTTSQAPSNANSMDANVAAKKAAMQNPKVNQAYIDAMKNQTPAPAAAYSWSGTDNMPQRPNYPGVYTTDYRMGGPYVLPMYQGNVFPGQVMSDDPFAGELNQVNVPNAMPDYSWDSGQNDNLDFQSMVDAGLYEKPIETTDFSDKFSLGYKFGKKKKKGVNPYAPAIARFAADKLNKASENAAQDRYMNKMLRADQVFNTFDQFRGDYTMNQPAGADFRPDQMVPVGNTGAGYVAQQGGPMMFDIADLFFLTPQMLKKTTSRR